MKSKNPIIRQPDYTKVKRCSECEYQGYNGYCKNNTLYRYLRNGCLKEPSQTAERNNMNLEQLNLSTRAYNSLRRAGIDTTEKLQALSDEELLRVRNLGEKCFHEVKGKERTIDNLTKLNKLEVIDWSLSGGECEYIHIENNEENIEALKDIGATEEDIENMLFDDDPDILDITLFAFTKAGAEYYTVGTGFSE